jgi:2-oxoacid:acceptor oxidoreductase delta subunit (pyruvate/2-ketoisovalerate family)
MINNNEVKIERVQPKTQSHIRQQAKRSSEPEIHLKSCEKNYNCVFFCPKNAVSINQKGYPVIDYELCDGCLICLRECPFSAIVEKLP